MNKQQVKNLKDLELYYNKCRKIKLLEDKYKSIQIIIQKVIDDKEPTFYSKGGHQCHQGSYRSLDDVIKVCKYYFPNYTIKKILKSILIHAKRESKFVDEYGRARHMQFCYCPNIRKDNFRGYSAWDWGDNFFKSLHTYYIKNQGFINCHITLQEIIDN